MIQCEPNYKPTPLIKRILVILHLRLTGSIGDNLFLQFLTEAVDGNHNTERPPCQD